MSIRFGETLVAGSSGDVYTKAQTDALLATKANSATTLAGYGITDGAKTDLSNLTSVGANMSNWSTNISSGIVEISEDIKVAYSGSTFTLKAGSVLYMPNGSGTFTKINISSNVNASFTTQTGEYVFIYNYTSGSIICFPDSQYYSGSNPTFATNTAIWYNTASASNIIRDTTDGGTTWSNQYTFPFAKVKVENGTITSILQVYNGFGYIGSTFYILPGVKSVCSNGRNEDGTLKGYYGEKTTVSVNTNSETNQPKIILVRGNAMAMARRLYVSAERPAFEENVPQYWYNPVTNVMWFYQTSSNQGESNMALVATANVDGSKKITNFSPRTTFRAVDYNDLKTLTVQKNGADISTYTPNNSVNQIINIPDAFEYSKTNCITEIPQDIKLELNDGTLTLKASSKTYVPNGSGVFNTLITDADKTNKDTTKNGQHFLCISQSGALTWGPVSTSTSGAGATPQANMAFAYDTTANTIKRYGDATTLYSFPIAICTLTSGTGITSIDQTFNGLGYIGSTVFALPGVKCLIPNGRNTDGTLKNTPLTIDSVKTITYDSTFSTNYAPIVLSIWGVGYWGQSTYYGGSRPSNPTNYTRWYSEEDNYWYEYVNGWNIQIACVVGMSTVSSGKATSFKTKKAFEAVDYSDTEYIAHQAMPSSKYVNLTLGASGNTYTAPADGWYTIRIGTNASEYLLMTNNSNYLVSGFVWPGAGGTVYGNISVSKGDVVTVEYNASGTVLYFRFVYAQGVL